MTPTERFTEALDAGASILAVCTTDDSSQCLERWAMQAEHAGRSPVVLAPGDLGPACPTARCAHHHLAAGTVLDAEGLIDWWRQGWWSEALGERSINPSSPLVNQGDQNLVLLGESLAHQVILHRHNGQAFSVGHLSDLLHLRRLFDVLDPSLAAAQDPWLAAARRATLRYAQALNLPFALDDVWHRVNDLPEDVMERHGWNHHRLAGTASGWFENAEEMFSSSPDKPGWDADRWVERREVVLVGGPDAMFVDPTYTRNNQRLFSWIVSDLLRGLPQDLSRVPHTLACVVIDPLEQTNLDAVQRTAEQLMLRHTAETAMQDPGQAHHRSRL